MFSAMVRAVIDRHVTRESSLTESRTGIGLGSWPGGMPDDPGSSLRVPGQVEGAGEDHSLFAGDHLFPTGENPDAECGAQVEALVEAVLR